MFFFVYWRERRTVFSPQNSRIHLWMNFILIFLSDNFNERCFFFSFVEYNSSSLFKYLSTNIQRNYVISIILVFVDAFSLFIKVYSLETIVIFIQLSSVLVIKTRIFNDHWAYFIKRQGGNVCTFVYLLNISVVTIAFLHI